MTVKDRIISRTIDPSTPSERLEVAALILEGGESTAIGGVLSVDSARAFLGGICRTTLWTLGKKGLVSVKLGAGRNSRTVYRRADLEDFINRMAEQEEKS